MTLPLAWHPWSLLIGIMFAGASLVSWVGPGTKQAARAGAKCINFDQFTSRFIFPILAGMFIVGAVAASSEVLPDNIWFHALLLIALVAELIGFVLPLIQRRQPRRT